jgi:hypothetical protein
VYVYPVAPNLADPCLADAAVPAYPLVSNTSAGNWHVTGTIGSYSGMGFWFQCNAGTATAPNYATTCMIDASLYTGISLTVSGTTGGPVNADAGVVGIYLMVSTPANTPTIDKDGNPTCGTCVANPDAGVTCDPLRVFIPVTAAASTVQFTWAQLGVTTPNAITGIAFATADPHTYPWDPVTLTSDGDASTPFAFDLTIDNIQFTTT